MAGEKHAGPQELLQALVKAMNNCEETLKNAPALVDANGKALDTYCPGEWDNLICWPNSPPGFVYMNCPEYVIDFNHNEHAKRYCDTNGTWRAHPIAEGHKYRRCFGDELGTKEEIEEQIRMGFVPPNIKSLIQLYTVGYSFSLVALTFAMFILAYFQRLHCTRNYIHMHLFASFMFRAIIIFVKDRVLFFGSGILDVSTDQTLEELLGKVEYQNSSAYLVGCKIVMTLFHYFVATNYFWILVEALYLHSLIFVAFFSDKKYLWKFILTGWGAPILFVGPWAIVRATLDNDRCWDLSISEYKWIYDGPIVVANVINFLLFLNIIRVLWYKMRESGAINRTDNRKQYRKLAKSTLVLIFMFGVHAIVFIGMPDSITDGLLWNIRMYYDLFFNSFQGFFVAIIYCFCNGEVQAEFKKAWERFNLSVEMQRGNRDRNRSSVTMLTSFNSSASQQARLSIAGQGNRRGSNALKNLCQTSNNNNFNGVNGYTPEYRAPLLDQNGKQDPKSPNKGDYLLNLGAEEHLAQYSSSSPSHQTSTLSKIVSIQEEDVEETALEMVLEKNATVVTETVTNSDENVATSVENLARNSERSSSSEGESSTSKCKRTPSFDSGISSMAGGNPRLSGGFSTNTHGDGLKKTDNSDECV